MSDFSNGGAVLVAAVNFGRAVEIGLWIGLCFLSITLLLLQWTRWGSVKTTHKCIWLSVLAHLLLVIYMYETRLILPGWRGGDREAIVPICLLADGDDTVEVDAELASQDEPSGPEPTDRRLLPELAAPDLLTLPPETSDPSDESQSRAAAEEGSDKDDAPGAPELVAGQLEVAGEEPLNPPQLSSPQSPSESSDPRSAKESEADSSQVALGAPSESNAGAGELEGDGSIRPGAESSPLPPATSSAEKSVNLGPIDTSPKASPLEPIATPEFRSARAPNSTQQPIAEIYSLRNRAQRHLNALKRGGTEGTEASVERALVWLAAHQQTDGRWNPRLTEAGREFQVLGHDRQGAGKDADTALTGLALLALLGAGHDHMQGEYRDNVRRGLEFVMRSQRANGDLAGDASLFAAMYSHGIAALALHEAYALTGDQRLKPFVDRAVAYSLAAQDPRTGGWRYRPGDPGDMSQFGWQVMALKSAQIGGAKIPTSTVERMRFFLDSCTSGQYMGLAAYRPRQSPSPTMTAEALACRYFLGQAVPDRTSSEAIEYIMQQPPGSAEIDYYLWYYATLSLYQHGGPHWEEWNRQLQRQLLGTQIDHGEHAGSWGPNGKWCGYGGRVFSTAMATLSLEVYYRYLPMLREQVAWK